MSSRFLHCAFVALAFSVFMPLASPSAAQAVAWSKVVNGSTNDHRPACREYYGLVGKRIAVASNGDFIVTGCVLSPTDFEMVTTRYDAQTGSVVWSAVWSSLPSEPYAPEAGDDDVQALALDPQGNVIVTGLTETPTILYPYGGTIRTIKYDGITGAILWNTVYPIDPGEVNESFAIATDSAANVFVVGTDRSPNGGIRTIKYDGGTGALAWTDLLEEGTGHACLPAGIATDGAGNAFMSGHCAESSGTTIRTVKYRGGDGARLWSLQVPGSVVGIAVDASGNPAIAGYRTGYYAAKYDGSTGAELWATAPFAAGSPLATFIPNAVVLDAAGNVVSTGDTAAGSARVLHTVKLLAANGAVAWEKTGDPDSSTGNSVAVDAQGDVAITGWKSTTPNDRTVLTAKYRAVDGGELWRNSSTGGTGYGVAFGADGNALVLGGPQVAKLSGTSGTQIWSRTGPDIAGPAYMFGRGVSPPRGGRIATGTFHFPATHLTLRDTATGNVVWEVETDPSGRMAARIDAAGGVVLLTQNGVEKRSAAGALEWRTPVGWSSVAVLELDAGGSPFIAGRSCVGFPCAYRYHAARLNPANGAILWTSVVDVDYSGWTYGSVDASGDFVVAGHGGVNQDFTTRTIKYSAATGAALWDVATPGSTSAFTLDGAGNAIVATAQGASSTLTKYSGGTGAIAWSIPGANEKGLQAFPGGDIGAYSQDASALRVMRRSSPDGSLLWGRTIDGATANQMAIDFEGNVVLVGPRFRKYHGASGATLADFALIAPGDMAEFADLRVDESGAAYAAAQYASPGRVRGVLVLKVAGGPSFPPGHAAFDFDGGGTGDLLFGNADGRAAIWLMNGSTPASSAEIIGAGTGWSVAGVADFNGDGKSDLAWQHSDGRVAVYLMNGTTPTATQQLLNSGPWSVKHTPDLDGDGKADLLFENADGSVAVWTMNGATMTGGATILGPGTGWSVIRTADFDGNGKDDLLWRHADGRHAIWLMNGINVSSSVQILNAGGWTATHTPDLNGDGKADILWQHSDGTIAAWLMSGAAMLSGTTLLNAGSGWSVTRTGDFNGDGKADLFFMHSDGRAAIYLMNGLAPTQTTQILNGGGGWSAKRLLDLDGDGKADIVWENVDGRVAVWLMNGTTMSNGSGILGPGTGWSVNGATQ